MKKVHVRKNIAKFLFYIFIFTLILPGDMIARKNQFGSKLIITKLDGKKIRGELLLVKKDSLLVKSQKEVTVKIVDIKEVKIKKSLKVGKGALKGLIFGSILGSIWACLEMVGDNSLSVSWALFLVSCTAAIGTITGTIISGLGKKYKTITISGKTSDELNNILKKLNKKARYINEL